MQDQSSHNFDTNNSFSEDSDSDVNEKIFSVITTKKRIACMDRIFNNNNLKVSIKSDKDFVSIIVKIQELLKSLRNNGQVNGYLIENNQIKLALLPTTRWQLHYDLIESFIKLEDHIPTLCLKIRKDNLNLAEYDTIEAFFKLLKMYKKSIIKFEVRKCKLSKTIPEVLNLITKLEKFKDGMEYIAHKLKDDLLGRYAHNFDPQLAKFNPINVFTNSWIRRIRYFSTSKMNMSFK